jgi:biopolymer transport protein ExbD
MKLKRRKVKRGRVEIIPMIDTIVILLIFYMTFARFAEATKEAGLTLPTSRAGEEQKSKQGQIILNMFNKDEVYYNKAKYTLEEVPALLNDIRTKNPAEFSNPNIVLRGNKSMKYSDLSEFMKACSKAKIANVTFTTEEIR